MIILQNSNVFSLLKNAEEILKNHNIKNPRSDVETLLSFVLNTKRSLLPSMREKEVNIEQFDIFKEYISRRIKREPVAYIIGYCGFMDFEFKVNRNVLIPRPETELLVEEVLKSSNKKGKVLDMCTGSGCIAISLAKYGEYDSITASDISKEALALASENALINEVFNIDFIESDMFNNLQGKHFDILVSNPPYISETEYGKLEEELKFEPEKALIAEENGMFFYKKIAEESRNYLSEDGMCFLEISSTCSNEIKEIFIKNGYKDIKILNDYASLPRILKAKV